MSDGPAAKPISLSLFPRGKYSHASSKRSISISSIGHVHVSLKTNNYHELCNSASNRLRDLAFPIKVQNTMYSSFHIIPSEQKLC